VFEIRFLFVNIIKKIEVPFFLNMNVLKDSPLLHQIKNRNNRKINKIVNMNRYSEINGIMSLT